MIKNIIPSVYTKNSHHALCLPPVLLVHYVSPYALVPAVVYLALYLRCIAAQSVGLVARHVWSRHVYVLA